MGTCVTDDQHHPTTHSALPKLRVFISYSRVDGVFAEMVRDALVARGYAVRLDKQDIVLGEDWRKRLDILILGVEVVLFIISPDSVDRWDDPPPHESVCAWEIKRTAELGKRLIAVDFRRGQGMTYPRELSVPNHVDATSLGFEYRAVADAFKAHRNAKSMFHAGEPELALELAALAKTFAQRLTTSPPWAALTGKFDDALNVESVLWERELTNWQARAEAWRTTNANQQAGKLLPIGELADVQAWARTRPASAPTIPALVTAFIQKSAEKLDADDIKQRRIIGRAFVKPAEEAHARGEHDHALRLAAAGALLAEDIGLELVPELFAPMAKAITTNRTSRVFKGHMGTVTVTAFSPDGKRMVTGSYDDTCRVWDSATGAEIAVLEGHTGGVNAASFSPDGKRVLTGAGNPVPTIADDDTARLWDAATGTEIAVLKGHDGAINAASFSPDGKRVLTGSDDNTARLWDASTGAEIAVLEGHTDGVNAASFSTDGKRVLTGSDDNTARLWDALSSPVQN